MSKNDKVTKPVVLDLDAIGTGSPKELGIVVAAQKSAAQQLQASLGYLASDEFAGFIKDANATAKIVADLVRTLDTSRTLAAAVSTNFQHISVAKQVLQESLDDYNRINKAFVASIQPLYDLRLATNSMMTDFHRQLSLLKGYTFDLSTLFGSVQVSETTRFIFENTTTTISSKGGLGLHATAVQTRSNQFVTQERTTKVDLLLSASKEQGATLLRLENDFVGVKSLVGQLIGQGQQRFSIKDVHYDPQSYYLKIGSHHRIEVKAPRERQLCELLLSTVEAMQKRWDIEEMLELIGEAFTTRASDYKKWTGWYYHAANRLNARLEPILGMKLINVDGKTQALYINPAFYHN
jgi:hypothetical protein